MTIWPWEELKPTTLVAQAKGKANGRPSEVAVRRVHFGTASNGAVLTYEEFPCNGAIRVARPRGDSPDDPIVAVDLEDFLRKLLDAGGRPYWEQRGFAALSEEDWERARPR